MLETLVIELSQVVKPEAISNQVLRAPITRFEAWGSQMISDPVAPMQDLNDELLTFGGHKQCQKPDFVVKAFALDTAPALVIKNKLNAQSPVI